MGRTHAHLPTPEHLDTVQRAVVEGNQVELGYVARDRSATSRVVHPLGLATKGHSWYLVAATDAGLRTFRVDRVTAVTPTGDPVVRPEGFELAEAWRLIVDEVDQQRAPIQARARVAAEAVGILHMMLGIRVRSVRPEPAVGWTWSCEATAWRRWPARSPVWGPRWRSSTHVGSGPPGPDRSRARHPLCGSDLNAREVPSSVMAHTPELRYVDPYAPRGRLYLALCRFSATKAGAWLAVNISWKLDPHLLRLTKGRFSTAAPLPTALLETRGARSGERRRNATIYFHDGDRVTIVASKRGEPRHPAWYHNLRAHPDVVFGGLPFHAEVVEDETERQRLWDLADRVFPEYAGYRQEAGRAGRVIPIVQLIPREERGRHLS